MASAPTHRWTFRARFRRHAFGWKSQPAIKRIREATSEIKKVSRKDMALAAEGAVLFLERLSPAIEQVDSSSGSIGAAVSKSIDVLVPIIAEAPADAETRGRWLERLFEAHADDEIPYIESLTESWGTLCASTEMASQWADQLLDVTRRVLGDYDGARGFFHGSTACLSALHAAGRHNELIEILSAEKFWPYKRWMVKALASLGRTSWAVELAESCRGPWSSNWDIDRLCEGILLSCGEVDEAYERYGLRASTATTYLATFRAVVKKYTHKPPAEILDDLIASTPGDKGKWFATAKTAKLYDLAIDLVKTSPCSPQTLTRAARDFAEKEPVFALEAGLAALRWIADGYGYDITGSDVLAAYEHTVTAATHAGCMAETRQRLVGMLGQDARGARYLASVLRGRIESL